MLQPFPRGKPGSLRPLPALGTSRKLELVKLRISPEVFVSQLRSLTGRTVTLGAVVHVSLGAPRISSAVRVRVPCKANRSPG